MLIPLKPLRSRVYASTIVAFSVLGFSPDVANAQENSYNNIKIEKLFKACPFGSFVVHHYYALITNEEQARYEDWGREFDSIKPLMNDVCESYRGNKLRDVEREIISDRINAANKCADKEGAAMAFREFGRAKQYTHIQALNLFAIRSVIAHAKLRDSATKDAQEAPRNAVELVVLTILFKGKAHTIAEAIDARSAEIILKDMVKEKIEEYPALKAFDSLVTDHYADEIKYNYDRVFGEASLLPGASYDCK